MSICLRCGNALPDGCYLTKKYCDKCVADRNRERARERKKKAVQRMIEAKAEKNYNADREYCKSCVHYGTGEYSSNLCDYILDTGHRRGCKAGVGCAERVMKDETTTKSV